MRGTLWGPLIGAAALSVAIIDSASTSGQAQDRRPGVLDEHSDIQYATRPAVKEAVYRRMLDTLSGNDPRATRTGLSAGDRRAILEIPRDTKSDFPVR